MRKNYPDLSNNPFIEMLLLRNKLSKLFVFLGLIVLSLNSYGQNNAAAPVPFVSANFDDLQVSKNTNGVCISLPLLGLNCELSNENNLINGNLTDYATARFGALSVGASHLLRVKDNNTTYAAGTFAGFRIGTGGGVLSLNLLNGITVKTYNDNVLQEEFSGASLLNLNLLSGSTADIVGFHTNKAFDAVEIVLDGGVSLLSSTRIYYAVIKQYSAGPALECNTVTKLSNPVFPVAISESNTGMSGITVGSVSNAENAISANDADYATINLTLAVAGSGSIAIKDQVTNYPAGTYAGFEIENTSLLSLAALGNVKVTTYLEGVVQDEFSGNDLVANVGLLSSGSRFKLGFVSEKAFDEVKLSVNQTVGLNLGTTRVYGAIFQKFCAGPELPCNVQTALSAPTYPVYINNKNSGIDGLVCALCTVTNQDNLIDTNLTNYASVNLSVGVGTTGRLSVKDQITNYPSGTFAGYTIENPALLTVGALGAVRITTYLDGQLQETKLGNDPLVSVGTDLLVGTGRQTIGFVSTKDFDEVQITFQNLASVNLGEVKVYNAVFQKLCDPIVECNKTYVWSNPAFPVTVNNDNTGIDGVACVACAVNDTNNLLTASTTDFANITLIAGVVGSGSVSVKDHLYTYPKGTFAGYVIRDLGTLAQVNLLQSLTISTYNNGVLQESRLAGQLIDLSLLGIDILGSTPGVYNIGFKTNLAFDEIKLTLSSVASVINSINVYGAFVDTSESDGGSGSGLECNSSSISVTKDGTYVDANADGIVNVGDRVDYVFDIKNTGFETLRNISLTDTNAVVTGTPIASLVAGANNTTNYTATYAITQADIDAGVVYNLATVNATTNLGTALTATSTDPTPCTTCPVNPDCTNCTATPLAQTPKIALVKTAVVGGTGVLGNTITYTFTVTNTGNTTLNAIEVTDPMTGIVIPANSITSLEPGATNNSITGTYVITQADVNAGKVTNSATVTAKDPKNNTITDISGTTITTDDSTVTPVTQTSKIALVKTASVGGTGTLGNTITYTFAVTNTGTTTLTNVTVTDPKAGLTIMGSPIASLAPGATNISIIGTYVITQADVDAGSVTNSAKVTAKNPQGVDVTDISGTTITTDDATITPVGQRSTIALVKTANSATVRNLGDTITYTFAVSNTGTTTLSNVVVTDPLPGLTLSGGPIASLAPGTTNNSITGTYVITQADVDAGKVTNSALVTARNPLNVEVRDVSGTTLGTDNNTETPVNQTASIALVKTAVVGGTGVLGNTITYTFRVTNTGTTTLNNIVVSDPLVGLTITGGSIATLAPGASANRTGTYVITQADVDAKKVTNSALVTAKDPQNNTITDISGTTITTNDSTVTPVTQTPGIALVKTAVYNGNSARAKVGDVITYTFLVRNTGTATLKNVTVTDPLVGLTLTGTPIASLAPGVSNATIKGSYTVTQADIDAGQVTNSALVTAQDPQNNSITDVSGTTLTTDDSTVTPITQTPSIALVKTAVVGGTGVLGNTITYTFTVTNTGNTTLTNVAVADPLAGLTLTGNPIASLAPGASNATIKGTYVIKQADIDAGMVTNSAVVTAKDSEDNTVTDVSGTTLSTDDATVTPVRQTRAIALVKTAVVGGTGVLGNTITYTFTVTNRGTTTLKNIVVTDPLIGLTITGNPIASLAPGASNATIKGTYTITQADIDAGKVTNSALVTAQDPQNNTITDVSGTTLTTNDNTVTPVTQNPKIALVKTAVVGGTGVLGDTITYTFAVTNTGNTTLNTIIVTDPLVGLTLSGSPIASLAPGATNNSITGTYVIKQADIDAGQVTNSALVTAQDPQNNTITDISGTTLTTNDSTVTPVTQNSKIALVKTAVVGGTGVLGNTITYTFAVTNTGNTTLNTIVVSDPMTGIIIPVNSIISLEPGATNNNIKGTYVITQADVDAGKVTNSASVTAKDPKNNTITDISGTSITTDDSTETPVTQTATIALVKTARVNGTGVLGNTIDYTFAVTNTGTTTLTNVTVTDPKIGLTIMGSPIASLAPGATNISITGTYIISQTDVNAGNVTNSAKVVAKDPQGVDVTDISGTTITTDDATITPVGQRSTIALVKTAAVGGTGVLGNTITYTFAVTNTGTTDLNNIVITDPLPGLTFSGTTIVSLAPGITDDSITGTYIITQADVDAGKVTNSALVTARNPLDVEVKDVSGTTIGTDDNTVTPVNQTASIALVKTAVVGGTGVLGNTITYTFRVTNTGTTTLNNIVVSDPLVGLTFAGGSIATLAPGASDSITGTYVITQTDVDAGKVTNSALVTAKDPQNNTITDISGTTLITNDSTVTPVTQTPQIALVKTAVYSGDATRAQVGDVITYTFLVRNTGTTTLKDVTITDPLPGLTIIGSPIASLAPGVSNATIKGSYAITQQDIDAGQVTNSALVTAQDPQNNPVTDTSGTAVDNNESTVTVLPKSASFALVKTGVYYGDASRAVVGDKITYTFTATNTGNVTIKNITINDAKLGLTNIALSSALAPLETETVIEDYFITQADIDTEKVINSALARGQDPQGFNVQDLSGTTINNDTSTETILPSSASLTLVKTAVYNGDATKAAVGDVINYTFTVTNTGNVTVNNLVINDAKLGISNLALTPSTLAPFQKTTVTRSYTITQVDINAGQVTNTAIARGQDPHGVSVQDISGTTETTDDATVTILPKSASLAFVKTAVYSGDATRAKVGDIITYTFRVTNTGNVTVNNIVINDAKLGVTNLALVPAALAPSATGVVTRSYVVTQADLNAGNVTNTAIARGQDPQGVTVQDTSGTAVDNNDATVTILPKSASLAFVKTAVYNGNAAKAEVGDTVSYTFTVTNTGNVTVNNIVIDDAKLGVSNLALVPATLAPLATGVVTGSYTITQADLNAGNVTNTAIAKGQDPQGIPVQDTSGTAVDNDISTVTVLPKSASLAFVKTGVYNGDATKAVVGDIVTYTFRVTNTGNVSVSNIVINDAKLGATNFSLVPATLAPLASGEVTRDYTITQDDINAGEVTNTAVATGQDPQGASVQDRSGTTVNNNTNTVIPLPKSASLAFVKTAVYKGNAAKAAVGDIVTYTFTVRNTGNVSLSNIVINDAKLGVVNLPLVPATLAPLASGVVTKDYAITQADIDAGSVTNTAIATGQDPQGIEVQDTSGTTETNNDSTVTLLPKSASLAFVKTGVYNGNATKAAVGDKITYTFSVTNTGNVTVSNIVINDAKLGVTNLPLVPATLAPSATAVLTQDYILSQADVNTGIVTNTAIAKGQDPQGIPVQDISGTAIDNDDATITLLPENAKIALILKGEFQDENNDGQAQIGETISYQYTIMNTGDVPLSNVWIENDLVGHGIADGSINLPVGAMDNSTFSATYSLTQADIVAGQVSNQAKVFGTSPLGVVVQDLSHETSALEDGFTVVEVDGCVITVFNAVSPNLGSEYEKILYIRGLDCYPTNSVQIFDRWGVKVFDVDGYDNATKAFRGISEGRVTVNQSKGLPSGTYFYVLKYVNTDGKAFSKSGYLHLVND